MFEKRSAAWVRRLKKGSHGRQRRFFRVAQNSDPEASHRRAQRHSARTRHLTRHSTTPLLATQTQTARQTQTTLAFAKWASLILKWPWAHFIQLPKTTVLTDMQFGPIHCVFSMIFVLSHIHVFSTQKRRHKPSTNGTFGGAGPLFELGPSAHPIEKVGLQLVSHPAHTTWVQRTIARSGVRPQANTVA